MYINRALLLLFAVVLIFLPALNDWLFSSDGAWYRPYLLWLLVVVSTYWNQYSGQPDEF